MPNVFRGSSSPYTKSQLRGRRFARVTHDVYVEDGDPADLWVRVKAASLVHPEAVICGRTAARLQNLPIDDDGRVHLCRGQLAARTEREEWQLHRLDLGHDEHVEIQGVPVTTGPRTWTDLAAQLTQEELVAIGDVVLRRYGEQAVSGAVERAWGRAGVVALREALPLLHPGADSPAESRARLRLHRAGFTALVPGVAILDEAGGWLAAPDLADPVARVAVQHDGRVHWEGGERQRRHDVDRDELSRAAGWEVVVSTATDDSEPARLLGKVAAAYVRAGMRRGRQVLPDHLRAA